MINANNYFDLSSTILECKYFMKHKMLKEFFYLSSTILECK